MPDSPALFKPELPTWKRGWMQRPVRNSPPLVVEFIDGEIHGISGGYYGFVRHALSSGHTFGPSLPSVQECAALDSARAEEKQSK